MSIDPFLGSDSLCQWAAGVLIDAIIDEISDWRMLEYWAQVKFYRAVQDGRAGNWEHLDFYEQPYFTSNPRSGSKSDIKFIDLVFIPPQPERTIWIELKDLGRSPERLRDNAIGLGHDLAALYGLDPEQTKVVWLDSSLHVVDKGRTGEWLKCAASIDGLNHYICQIVLAPKALIHEAGKALVIENWRRTFERRAQAPITDNQLEISDSKAQDFAIFALVAPLSVNLAH